MSLWKDSIYRVFIVWGVYYLLMFVKTNKLLINNGLNRYQQIWLELI